MSPNSPLVLQAYDVLAKNTAPERAQEMRQYAERVAGVIENHSGLPAGDREALKITAILYLAKVDQNNALSENQIDIVFGKKVGDAIKSFKQTSITDESKIVDASAVVMAISAANMEGTLAKLSSPATYADGVRESGGKQAFRDYGLAITEERLMLTSYAQTPALLKYEMKLLGQIDERLAGVSAPAPQVAAGMKL